MRVAICKEAPHERVAMKHLLLKRMIFMSHLKITSQKNLVMMTMNSSIHHQKRTSKLIPKSKRPISLSYLALFDQKERI